MSRKLLKPSSIEEINTARVAIKDFALITPLVKLNVQSEKLNIFLKLENLQPIGD